MRKRNSLFRKSKINPEYRNKYNQLRNKIVSQLRREKKSFVQNITTDKAKAFWKSVKLLNGKRSTTIPVLAHDGEVVGDKEKADVTDELLIHLNGTVFRPPRSGWSKVTHFVTRTKPKVHAQVQPTSLGALEMTEAHENLQDDKVTPPDPVTVEWTHVVTSRINPIHPQIRPRDTLRAITIYMKGSHH